MAIVTGKAAFIELANSLLVYGNDVIDETNCSVGLPIVFNPDEIDPDEIGNYSLVNTSVEVTALEDSPFSGFRKIYYTRLDFDRIESFSIKINFNNVGENFDPTLEQIVDAFNEVTLFPIGYDEVNLRLYQDVLGNYNGGTLTSKPSSYTCIGVVDFEIVFDQQKDIRTAIYNGRMFNGY